ncbi:hypothetical protein LXA43DRAFT_1094512 [Ganoderma leucocontextum]|nr:hypothetical protein LXA43DRAFT_1094512 [Ganoderma leucocontextum]
MSTIELLHPHVYFLLETRSKNFDSADDVRSITLLVNGVLLSTAEITLTLIREHELLQCIELAEGDTLHACDLQDKQRASVLTLLHAYRACYFQLGVAPSDITVFFRLVAEAAMSLDDHEPADQVLEDLAAYVREAFSAAALGSPEHKADPLPSPVMAAPSTTVEPTVGRAHPVPPSIVAGMRVRSPRPKRATGHLKTSAYKVNPAPDVTSPAPDITQEPALDLSTPRDATGNIMPAPGNVAVNSPASDVRHLASNLCMPPSSILAPLSGKDATPPEVDAILRVVNVSTAYVDARRTTGDPRASPISALTAGFAAPSPGGPGVAAAPDAHSAPGATVTVTAASPSTVLASARSVSVPATGTNAPAGSPITTQPSAPVAFTSVTIPSSSIAVERTIGGGRHLQRPAPVCESDDDGSGSDDTCPSLRSVVDSSDEGDIDEDEEDGNEAMRLMAVMAFMEAYLMEHLAARREAARGAQ